MDPNVRDKWQDKIIDIEKLIDECKSELFQRNNKQSVQ